MKGRNRRQEDKAKQDCFMSALQHIKKNTSFSKFTVIAREMTGHEQGDEYTKTLNLLYSIKNKRSTPPDYLAHLVYDTFSSSELFEILTEHFPINEEVQQHVPIEEELPEMLLDRIRELKKQRDELKVQLQGVLVERAQLADQLEQALAAKSIKNGALDELVAFLRSDPFKA